MSDDRRLIEDYLPIQAISVQASREDRSRAGHVKMLHLWRARRPLVACRAVVYAALVPASRFRPANGPEEKRDSLTRANAAKFVERLCKYPGDPNVIAEAERHILEAHAERLTRETGATVTVDDIIAGRAPRPKVLDMFAGGGAIPLEALRLGCEAYALDLNPVAHIIELCTLVYPQKYGKPDLTAKGSAMDGTWAGLPGEVRYWGQWVHDKVRKEISDLYPPIADPAVPKTEQAFGDPQLRMAGFGSGQREFATEVPRGYLIPVAYLWTRTVRCKNPACDVTVPLVRQTWLRRKKARYVALRMIAIAGASRARFEVAESSTEKGLGFDPSAFSKGGSATCPFCGTVADNDYVQAEGRAGRVAQQLMAIACARAGARGKLYVSGDQAIDGELTAKSIQSRLDALCARTGLSVPNEQINPLRPSPNARGLSAVTRHGLVTFGNLFTARQAVCLLSFVAAVREAIDEMRRRSQGEDHLLALGACLALAVDKMADYSNTISRWGNDDEGVTNAFSRQALPMVWDYAEASPWSGSTGSIQWAIEHVAAVCDRECRWERPATVVRGSATELPWTEPAHFDAVVTDPPYYDNVPYADLSDFFYVWLRRSIGHLYPEHFSTDLTPKKAEATALASRHGGDMRKANAEYEAVMLEAFRAAARVLKPTGQMVVVYAHKTTLGWTTLVDAMRRAGLVVTEAWPLDTESAARLAAHDTASLASSIFLVAGKRDGTDTGSYENQVRADLDRIVRERVATLWEMGIAGGDLIIAAVGAGLRAFTRFARVEYANGEEVPAERFLAEVEGVVLDTLLEKIFGVPRAGVATVDGASRFYVLWRYTYKAAEMDAGEAIVFTYGQPVELDGADGLSSGPRPLVRKKKGKYRLLDFTERGADEKLGLQGTQAGTPAPPGGSPAPQEPAPLIDVLHRVLWLVENEPRSLNAFLDAVQPDRERLRLIAQTLARAGLSGRSPQESGALVTTTAAEQTALGKLLANWRALIDTRLTAMDTGLFGGARSKETAA